MNDRQLQHFSTLAELLSFRDAAEKLNIVQPALSMSIKRLETELGVDLFERSTRHVRLTEPGKAALLEINKALRHLELARQNALLARNGSLGGLSVGFVGSASYSLLPAGVRAFRASYPNVTISLQESTGTRILSLIESGDIDVGIVRIPGSYSPGVRLVPLSSERLVAVVPTEGPWAVSRRRKPIALNALAGAPFINFSSKDSPMLHMAVVDACREAGFSPLIVQEVIQVQTLITLVESGLGVGLVPSVSAQHQPRNARFLPLANPTPACFTALALAYKPSQLTVIGQNFVETLVAVAGEATVGHGTGGESAG